MFENFQDFINDMVHVIKDNNQIYLVSQGMFAPQVLGNSVVQHLSSNLQVEMLGP